MSVNIKIFSEKDHLKAYVQISAIEGVVEGPCFEDVIKELNANNITFGIISENIITALQPEKWGEIVLVAEGIPPINGTNAYLVNKFTNLIEQNKPQLDDKGNVNFKDLGIVKNVLPGELLVEKVPAIEGQKGMSVFGKELGYIHGRECTLPEGKNTYSNEEKTLLYSNIKGRICIKNQLVSVEPIFELTGDVDYTSGNIDFVGDVIIHGNVCSGFEVKADGNIKIVGFIENAQVIAGANIEVKGGIKTGVKGYVKAGGNISARFVESSSIEALGDVIIEQAIIQSKVIAGGNVKITGSKATIMGGHIQAVSKVTSKYIGSQLATQTIIEVGIKPELRLEYQKIRKEYIEKQKDFEIINKNLKNFQNIGIDMETITSRKRITILKMIDQHKFLRDSFKATERRINELEVEFMKIDNSCVIAQQMVYPGVRINIGTQGYIVNDVIKNVKFILEHGEVRCKASC